MANNLFNAGFAILRLNLRGAGAGRYLSGGTYSAKCNTDLTPVIKKARNICKDINFRQGSLSEKIPLFGIGISLGGTILLNKCLDHKDNGEILFDGLACTSSPIDLLECSRSIERSRNRFYQKWLLHRLIQQTILDPFNHESNDYKEIKSKIIQKDINTIKDFDSLITAPRWGYKNVKDYYKDASPIDKLLKEDKCFPPTLFLQSLDDPWVPSNALERLFKNGGKRNLEIIITNQGGHNGFHSPKGCWGDNLVKKWLLSLC